jgi:hypothetical protein
MVGNPWIFLGYFPIYPNHRNLSPYSQGLRGILTPMELRPVVRTGHLPMKYCRSARLITSE